MLLATISAISFVLISSSLPSSFMPSSIIVRQKGHPTATVATCRPTISSGPFQVDSLADGLLHPHPPPAGAAAEAFPAVPVEFLEPVSRSGPQNRPGLIENPNCSAPGSRDRGRSGRPAMDCFNTIFPSFTSRCDELGMVDHLVIPAHLGIFVLERVEAMGARRDNFLDLVAVERLDVFLRHHLEQHFIADAPGKVAGAFFLHAQNRRSRTPALCRILTRLVDTFLDRSSNEPAQPTQNR